MKKILSRTTITVMSAVAALMTCATYLPAAEGDNATDNHAAQRGQFVRKDYKFARDAYNANLLEVRLGELAKQKGSIEAAKQFADQMVKDHTKANDELKQIIEKKGAVLPGQLSHRQESEYTRLQKLTGKDFDKSYADHMVKEHKKDIKEFRDGAKDLQDLDLKAFAQKTLPTLEHHEQMAEQLESSVKQQEP